MSSVITMIEGQPIETAELDVIDFSKLGERDPLEVSKLLDSASSHGFFYLDLRHDTRAKNLLQDLPDIYRISDLYFSQSEEEKLKDIRTDQKAYQDRGYKSSNCDETFEISDDEMINGNLRLPAIMRDNRELITRFSSLCNTVCKTLLPILSSGTSLPSNVPFERYHQEGIPSDSGLKLIFEPCLDKVANVGDNTHTDSGTLTLLFYDQWGLEAQLPGSGTAKWAFTPYIPGCALLNIADSLQRLSHGKFHSPVHRVRQPVDGARKRFYISYFLRPDYVI